MLIGKAITGFIAGFTPSHIDPWLHALGDLIDAAPALAAAAQTKDVAAISTEVADVLDDVLDAVDADALSEDEQDAILAGAVALTLVVARAVSKAKDAPRKPRRGPKTKARGADTSPTAPSALRPEIADRVKALVPSSLLRGGA